MANDFSRPTQAPRAPMSFGQQITALLSTRASFALRVLLHYLAVASAVNP
jgi:hypothetical protein